MRLSKLSNKHWRNKLSEVSEAFVVLTRKVGSALDQVRETALIAHTLIMQAEPLVLNATETLFHVKKACHSFSSVVDSLGKIDSSLTSLQAHVREQDKNAEKAQAPASMMSDALGGKVNVATTKICHICQEEAHYTDLDTGKYLCGKHAVPLRPDRGCHLCDALATHEDTNGSYLCAHHASIAGPGVLRPL